MKDLISVTTKLQDTVKTIDKTEKALSIYPDTPSLISSLRSLRERQKDLEETFSRVSNRERLDVCTYRLFTEHDEPITLKALSSTLLKFQNLYTVVYDALKNGPKKRSYSGAESVNATSFQYAYTIPGSVGVVLTMPNDRLLTGDTLLDQAMNTTFEMAGVTTSKEVRIFAEKLGVAPVWKMYEWAVDQAHAGLGFDIQWRRENEVKTRLFKQKPELEALGNTIYSTSEEKEDTIQLTGQLKGADVTTHSFHLVHGKEHIKGKMSESIGITDTVELPKPYKATIKVKKTINYATGTEYIEYFLLNLTPVD